MEKNKNSRKSTNHKKTKKTMINDESLDHKTAGSEEDQRVKDKGLQSLLERKKLHLVLDLDNTLIHCTTLSNRCKLALKDKGYNKLKKAVEDGELREILGGCFVIKLRPGARAFIEELSDLFDFSIYTKSGKAYAVEVAKLLADKEDGSSLFTQIISSKENSPKETEKELAQVKVPERAVLVVDDRVDVWRKCDAENIINIKPYHFFPEEIKGWPKMMKDCQSEEDDGELARVLSILKDVHSMFYRGDSAGDDVRQVLKTVQAEPVR